jgi:PII-like signaling protein
MKSVILRIYLKDSSTYHGKSVHETVLEFLRDSGIRGATLLRGIEGYGADGKIRSLKVLALSNEIPLVIETVDEEEKLRPLIPKLREIVGQELMTLQAVEIV